MCARCAQLEELLHDSEAMMADTVSALQRQITRSARAEQAAIRELNRVRESDPKSKLIREVLNYWMAQLQKDKRTLTPLSGDRADKVRARLNEGYTVDRCKLAIDGLARFPCVGPKGRVPAGQGDRHDDVKIALESGSNLERFEGYAERPVQVAPTAPATPKPFRKPQSDPVARILAALEARGCTVRSAPSGESWSAQCPAHDDRQPSLSISWRPGYEEDQLLVNCFAGCETVYVLDALGLSLSDLWGKRGVA